MSGLRRLVIVELLAQCALAICALLFALSIALFGVVVQQGRLNDGMLAVLPLALIVFTPAAAPVAIVLAPIYAILEKNGRTTYLVSAIAGGISGLIGTVALHTVNEGSREGLLALLPICLVLCTCVGAMLHVLRTWAVEHVHAT